MKTKVCKKCHTTKDISCFSKNRANKDGLKNSCKSCDKAYKEANKEKIAKQRKEKLKDPVYREEKNRKHRLWKHNNPDKIQEWKDNNLEKVKSINRKSYYKNLSRSRLVKRSAQRRRRAIKKDIHENFTKEDEVFILKLFKHKCFCCNSKENLSIDHHNPLSKGHALEIGNAVVLCKSCNSKKSDKLPKDFYTLNQIRKLRRLGVG